MHEPIPDDADQVPGGIGRAGLYRAWHGTENDFRGRMEPSKFGSFGSGLYAGDWNVAEDYSDDGFMLTLSIPIDRPLVVSADYDMGEMFDLESGAVPLVMALLRSDAATAADFIRRAMLAHGLPDPLLGAETQKMAEDQGHDGLILIYEPGVFEVVSYRPTQVIIEAVEPGRSLVHAS